MPKPKLIRITTVPISLEKLLSGQIGFMKAHYEVKAVSSEPDRLAAFGQAQNIETHAVGLTRKLTPIQDLKALWQLYRYLKKERPFIVHSHTPKAGTIGMLAAKLAGVPHRLHTVAGLPLLVATGNKRRLLDAVEKLTYAAATKVYPNSFGLRDIIIGNGYCKPNKLKVIGHGSSNGIDTAHFDPDLYDGESRLAVRRSLGLDANHFIFVFVGRLVKDKGVREMVAAFEQISKQYGHAKLLLVGRYEPELDPLDEMTQQLIANNPNIIETGYQTDVRPYFAASDALVFPSYREGFPNVVLQAAAMGLPAIVSDINGCNEIIADGSNGLIVPVRDGKAIREAMGRLLEDTAVFEKMRSHSRETIRRNYEQRQVWEAILEEYKSLGNPTD